MNFIYSGAAPHLLGFVHRVFALQLRFQENHEEALSRRERERLKSITNELIYRLQIKEQVEVKVARGIEGSWSLYAEGAPMLSDRVGYVIDLNSARRFSPEELEFLIAHELSHLKSNDLLWMGVVPAAAALTTTLAADILFPSSASYFSDFVKTYFFPSPAALVGQVVGLFTLAYFSQWREECADRLAFSVCSDAAKKAAPRVFEKFMQVNASQRISFLSQLTISKEGENRLDILHPSLKSRIHYLSTAS